MLAALTILAGLYLAGLWENLRALEAAIRDGRETVAMTTGVRATDRYWSILTWDGPCPRLTDEREAVDLEWTGADGRLHKRQQVPITGDYYDIRLHSARALIGPVTIRVIDGENAVPTISEDSAGRLDSLKAHIRYTIYALAAFFAAMLLAFFWPKPRHP